MVVRSVETRYSLVVLAASFFGHALFCLMVESAGVYHYIFLQAFGGRSGDTAIITSLMISTCFIIGPIVGLLVTKLGYRMVSFAGGIVISLGLVASAFATQIFHLYITFGFITGFGLGMTYIPGITIIGEYFDKHRALAFGIASAGCGVGRFIAPLFVNKCNEHFGWRGTLLIVAGVMLNNVVFGLFYRPRRLKPPKQVHIKNSDNSCRVSATHDKETYVGSAYVYGSDYQGIKKKAQVLDLLRNIPFILLQVSLLLFSIGYMASNVHLAAFAATKGVTSHQQSIIYSVYGGISIAGKLILGSLAMLKCLTPTFIYIIAYLLSGLGMIVLTFSHTFETFLLMAMFIGFATSPYGALTPLITANMVDVSLLPTAYGFACSFVAVGSLVGPPIAGWLYDYTDYYPSSFFFGGAVIILSGLVMCFPGTDALPRCFIKNSKLKLASIMDVNEADSEEGVLPDTDDSKISTDGSECTEGILKKDILLYMPDVECEHLKSPGS